MSLFLGTAYIIRGPGEHRRALCIGKSGWHSVLVSVGTVISMVAFFLSVGGGGGFRSFLYEEILKNPKIAEIAQPLSVCIHRAHACSGICLSSLARLSDFKWVLWSMI